MACAECDDSLPFSGASSIPLCYIPFPSTIFHQLVFHPTSLHLAIYFLVYLSALLFPNSHIIHFWEFYCLPFSLYAQTSIIYLTLLSLLYCLHLYFNKHLGLMHSAWYKAHQPVIQTIIPDITVSKRESSVLAHVHTQKSNTHCTSWVINYQ
jgi:hypothetical protein